MKKLIKILYPIGTYYPSQEGGPSNSVYWLCEGLKEHDNIKTKVVTTKKGINTNEIEVNKWRKNQNNNVIFTNSQGYMPFLMVLKSISELRKTDIVHLTSLFYPPSFIILIFNTLFYRKKVIVSVRGELNPYALENFRFVLKRLILKLWSVHRKKIHFHCTVNEEEEQVKSVFGDEANTIVLPNFMLFKNSKGVQKTKDQKYFLFLGRIHKIKGLENLLKALNQSMLFKKSDIILKIAGQGEADYENKIRNLTTNFGLNDKVKFVGHVEGQQKNDLLSQAYFLLFPSHSENFGNVVLEALINGTPVLASKGTPWKKLEDYNSGFWVDNDVDTLIKSIDNVIEMTDQNYELMSKNALNLANEEFNILTNSHKWEIFYKQKIDE